MRNRRNKAEKGDSAFGWGEGNTSDYKITNTFEAFKKPRGQASNIGREERQISRRECMETLSTRGKWPQKRRNNRRKCQRLTRKSQQKPNRSGRMVRALLADFVLLTILTQTFPKSKFTRSSNHLKMEYAC